MAYTITRILLLAIIYTESVCFLKFMWNEILAQSSEVIISTKLQRFAIFVTLPYEYPTLATTGKISKETTQISLECNQWNILSST
jgi:hypothetical protein